MDNTTHNTEAEPLTEPLTEVEAEEALRALATTLRWKAVEGGGFRANLFKQDGQPNGYYYVSPGPPSSPTVRVSRMFWDNSVQAYPKGFANVQEGITACERHYETYKWEL